MVNEFEEVLSVCIDRIVMGDSVEDCLLRYPDHARELEPLLRTAIAARQAGAVKARPEFKAVSGYHVRAAFRERTAKHVSSKRGAFQWLPRWAVATAVVLVVLVVGATGTVAAASDALPGNVLYPVKLAGERVQMAVTFSDEGKAKLYIEFADRRAAELVNLAATDAPERIEETAARLTSNLAALEALAAAGRGPADETKAAELEQELARHAARSLDALDKAQTETQETAKEAVDQARDKMLQGYNSALEAMQKRGR